MYSARKFFFICAEIFAAVAFFVSLASFASAAATPPAEAQCTAGNHVVALECTGKRTGVLISVEGAVDARVWQACDNAEGAVLRYPLTTARFTGAVTSWDWYCYEATEEYVQEFRGVHVSTTRGHLPPEEAAAWEAEKECSSGNVFCIVGQVVKGVAGIGTAVTNALINGIVGSLATILQAVYAAVAKLLLWAITTLIGISMLPGADKTPEFVTQGWHISKNIVNLIFLVLLAFIGLATILRLQSYQLQKTLPLLIIIALLINFSGVLVAFIVDISNIFTNAFLQAMQDKSWHISWPSTSEGVSDLAGDLGLHLSRIIFYALATVILLAVTLLFFVRVLVLWILTILAPFAFAAYILPSTQSLWGQWWKALIQWAIIGVPMSFFLFLATFVLTGTGGAVAPEALGGAGALASFLGPITALFILAIGFMISMSLAPAGAQKVLDYGKNAGLGATKFARGQTVDKFLASQKAKEDKAKGSSLLGKLRTRTENFAKGTEGRRWYNPKERGKNILRGALAPVRLGVATGTRKGIQYGGTVQQNMGGLEKDFEGIAKDEVLVRARAQEMMPVKDDAKLSALISAAAKAKGGKIKKWFTPDQLKRGLTHLESTNPGKIEDILKHVPELATTAGAKEHWGEKGIGMAGKLQNAINPDGLKKKANGDYEDKDVQHLATEDEWVQHEMEGIRLSAVFNNKSKEEADAAANEYLEEATVQRKLAKSVKDADIPNLDADAIAHNAGLQRELAKKTSGFLRRLFDEMGTSVATSMQDQVEKMAEQLGHKGQDAFKFVAKYNPALANMPYTSAGEHLLREWGGLTEKDYEARRKEAKNLIRDVQKASRPSATSSSPSAGTTPGSGGGPTSTPSPGQRSSGGGPATGSSSGTRPLGGGGPTSRSGKTTSGPAGTPSSSGGGPTSRPPSQGPKPTGGP
ncbi:MAG: hypothetical protein Q8P39_02430 [Candidatus Yanofskybacteria bacterium]|nr:hypothetical protein [Candidatus Yanofskybacteria bacterium]